MSLLSKLQGLGRRPFRSAGPDQAAELIDGGALLLDVRERYEWEAVHAPQAVHIPLGKLSRSLHRIPRDRTVVAVCRSGMRSSQAAKLLSQNGYEVVNLVGGMNAWQRAGLPVVGRAVQNPTK